MPGDLAVASAVFDCFGADCFGAVSIENGAETKHLNSTRTAKPPKGPGSSSRIQMLQEKKPIENEPKTIENGAETKHLNSIRAAGPPKGPAARIEFKCYS